MYLPVSEKELILFNSSKIRNKFKHAADLTIFSFDIYKKNLNFRSRVRIDNKRKTQFHKKSYSVVMKLNRIFALHFSANDLYQAGTLRQSDVLMRS